MEPRVARGKFAVAVAVVLLLLLWFRWVLCSLGALKYLPYWLYTHAVALLVGSGVDPRRYRGHRDWLELWVCVLKVLRTLGAAAAHQCCC